MGLPSWVLPAGIGLLLGGVGIPALMGAAGAGAAGAGAAGAAGSGAAGMGLGMPFNLLAGGASSGGAGGMLGGAAGAGGLGSLLGGGAGMGGLLGSNPLLSAGIMGASMYGDRFGDSGSAPKSGKREEYKKKYIDEYVGDKTEEDESDYLGTGRERTFFERKYFAGGGLASLGGGEGNGKDEGKDQALIEAAAAALMGQGQNPEAVLKAFVEEFGPKALQDLMQRVQILQQGNQSGGMSDGMSDSIPASIEGKQPAAISEGEYIVPADAVSGLGNGDTASGARQLEGMVDRIRTQKGMPKKPKVINPMEALMA